MNKETYRNKRIVLFARRNMGLLALVYLLSRKKKSLKVVTDDEHIISYAKSNRVEVVSVDTMGDYDLLVSVHWNKIIPVEYLKQGKSFNVHPCLRLYRGKDPVRRYIDNRNTEATVESHYMTEVIDGGAVIHFEKFETGVINSHERFYNIAFPYYLKCLDETMNKISGEIKGIPEIMNEIIGKRYGRLVVIGFACYRGKRKMVSTKCDCGKEKNIDYSALKSGATQSCGCLALETLAAGREKRKKHGQGIKGNQTRLFRVWCAIIARCSNPNNQAYKNYGGRGIKVCERWSSENGFSNFFEDMGERPSENHSIDRIDNDNGYSPENCKWATRSEQLNNKRNNHRISVNGEEMTITQAANKYNKSFRLIKSRINLGWSILDAVNTPKGGKRGSAK
jgi:hypothetical protein